MPSNKKWKFCFIKKTLARICPIWWGTESLRKLTVLFLQTVGYYLLFDYVFLKGKSSFTNANSVNAVNPLAVYNAILACPLGVAVGISPRAITFGDPVAHPKLLAELGRVYRVTIEELLSIALAGKEQWG